MAEQNDEQKREKGPTSERSDLNNGEQPVAGKNLGEALQAATAIGDEAARANALTALTGQLDEALQAARAIGDETARADALAALAGQLDEALQAATAIGDEAARADALDALAKHLSPGQLDEALRAARAIGDETARADALAALAGQLDKALQAATAIGDEAARADALVALAEHLSPGQLGEALRAARAIGDETARLVALDALTEHLLVESPKTNPMQKIAAFVAQWMSGRWPDRLIVFASLVLVLLVFGGLVWVCWFWWMGEVWNWGFEEFSWRSFVAPFGIMYLAVIPIFAVMLFPPLVSFWNEYGVLRQQVTSAREAQRQIERQLLRDDPHQLIMILSYSREMLSEYYGIAMSQAQRSFRYCLIAMWLGFFILIAGVLDNFLPLTEILTAQLTGKSIEEFLDKNKASVAPNDLVLITGAVIEFIAAAFLWVYRFSIQQQTYYYRRQLKLHNALLAHRLSQDMTQTKDEAIKMIVERLLDEMEGPTTAAPSSSGIGKLLKRT